MERGRAGPAALARRPGRAGEAMNPPTSASPPGAGAPEALGAGLALADGTRVPVRPIGPADAGALQRFHSRLSGGSIFLRFFHYVRVLTAERAAYFTRLDGVNRAALVALDPHAPRRSSPSPAMI